MQHKSEPWTVVRAAGLIYGWLAFAMTFAFFTAFVLFLGNIPSLSDPWITPSVDVGPERAPFLAALIDLGLVALFGLQHSAPSRRGGRGSSRMAWSARPMSWRQASSASS